MVGWVVAGLVVLGEEGMAMGGAEEARVVAGWVVAVVEPDSV